MDSDTERERKLKEDLGLDLNLPKGAWRESEDRLIRKLEESEIIEAQKLQAASLRKEVDNSERKRLEQAISALGFRKEDVVGNFPTLAENFERIQRQRSVEGMDLESPEGQADAFFHLQFGVVISLLESDEELSKQIITTWPEEYGRLMQFHRRAEKRR